MTQTVKLTDPWEIGYWDGYAGHYKNMPPPGDRATDEAYDSGRYRGARDRMEERD